jgi:septum formation protein
LPRGPFANFARPFSRSRDDEHPAFAAHSRGGNLEQLRVRIVLASSSPYRRALLERLRLEFIVDAPSVDERPLADEPPPRTALRLAEVKARAVVARHPHALVIGSDQVAALDDRAMGKPGSRDAALEQLRSMRGRSVVFHSALCLLDAATGRTSLDNVPTTVRFRRYSDTQAARYLDLDRPYDCTGSARIEALGIALIESVESKDPTALIGLPLISLITMLGGSGVHVL